VDTSGAFEAFARAAALESPPTREEMWLERYESIHPEVFAGFYAAVGGRDINPVLFRELSHVRTKVREAAPLVARIVEDTESRLPELLGHPSDPAPIHVLLVGGFSTNAVVGRVGGEVAVFHCLEWFQAEGGSSVLAAHEGTHGWHELALATPIPKVDPAWTAFSEGIGIQASRAAVPGRPESEYFWYDQPGFEHWLPWCEENSSGLVEEFAALLEDPDAYEAYFGAGLVHEQRRVGYFVADVLVAGLGKSLPDLMSMSVDDGRKAIVEALGRS